jgi:hypothetical protein
VLALLAEYELARLAEHEQDATTPQIVREAKHG